jgi:chemotaxis response regulator CheB
MPRAAVAAGGVDRVVSLDDMASAISDALEPRHG